MVTATRDLRSLLAGALLVLLAGCGMSSARPKAEAAVTAFHRQLDMADYVGIWTAADDAYREGTRREDSDKLMEAVHRKLGRVVKSETTNWSVRTFNLKTSVILAQNTQFERGSGTEIFTYVTSGDGVKLAGYRIQSTDLITL